MSYSIPRPSRFSRTILAAILLLTTLLHGAMPSAFAARSAAWPGDAIPKQIEAGQFSGTVSSGKSVWFRFYYPGGSATASIYVSFLTTYDLIGYPPEGNPTNLFIYTADPIEHNPHLAGPGLGVWRSEEARPLLKLNTNKLSPLRNARLAEFSLFDPNPRQVVIEFRNGERDTVSFEGDLRIYSSQGLLLDDSATGEAVNPGPVAETPHGAITLGTSKVDLDKPAGPDNPYGLVGTIAPRHKGLEARPRKVWYRVYYDPKAIHPEAFQRLCATFIHDPESESPSGEAREPGFELKFYVGSDPNSLSLMRIPYKRFKKLDPGHFDGKIEDNSGYVQFCRDVSLPKAQFIYFALANDTDRVLAYAVTGAPLALLVGGPSRDTGLGGQTGQEVTPPTKMAAKFEVPPPAEAQLDLSRVSLDALPATATPPITPQVTPATPPNTPPATQPASPPVKAPRAPRVTPLTISVAPPANPSTTPPDAPPVLTVAPVPAPTEPSVAASDVEDNWPSFAEDEPGIDGVPQDDSAEEDPPE